MAKTTFFHRVLLRLKQKISNINTKLGKLATRANAAHFCMILFVLFNSIGAWMFAPQYGLITAGVCSGIYGFLLGNE